MKKKIGWQKYETLLEDQMSSSFVSDIINNMMSNMQEEETEEDEELSYEDQIISKDTKIVPFSSKMLEEAMMVSNFDCWVGHTNFNITEAIKKTLDKIDGIEIMKVMSRYRFFVGIGKMFDFTNVRQDIEENLLQED